MDLRGRTMAITGAGGFIGLRMAERARARGMRVRGIDLDPAAVARAARAGVEAHAGDVCDPDAAARLCAGADVVFHTAAILNEDGPWDLSRRVNVHGTATVAAAAAAAGAPGCRLVHLSSVMVYGFVYPPYVTEEGPLRGEGNPYCQTKIESEEVALARHGAGGLGVLVVRPGDVYGPGSVPWVVRPLQFMKRGLAAHVGHGVMNHVYVDNLLDAVLLAVERDVTGIALNVADGRATTFREYFDRLAAATGGRVRLTLGAGAARALFGLVAAGARLAGRPPPATPTSVDFITRLHPVSIERARRLLDWEPRVGLDQGMAEVARWARAEGLA